MEASGAVRENKRDQIVRATMELIITEGVAAVTHKAVARQAGVSLAATTYYFKTKDDFLLEAIHDLMDQYRANVGALFEREIDGLSVDSFGRLVEAFLHRGIGRFREANIAWSEIMHWLSRREAHQHLVREWTDDNIATWVALAEKFGVSDATVTGINTMDTHAGIMGMFQLFGKNEADLDRIFKNKQDPLQVLSPVGSEKVALNLPQRVTPKSRETREKVLYAALEILAEGGIQALTHKAVADRAGLTVAVPTYHFSSKSKLLAATFQQLVAETLDRFRDVMGKVDYSTLTTPKMLDLTALIVQSEITQYPKFALARAEIDQFVTRDPALKPLVWMYIADQTRAWNRLLETLGHKTGNLGAFLIITLISGKMYRHISRGSDLADLISLREELAAGVTSILNRSHWAFSLK